MEKELQEILSVAQPPSRVALKPESWLAKIEFINHLILFNNVLITVLAQQEGGKSSFATLLSYNLDSQIKLLSITVKAPCDHEAIINDIATQFHLKHNENTDLSSLIAQINERKAHVLLLIDDAQHLPETFIKEVMLAIKNQDNFNFFHLLLVADYSIVAMLNGFSASFFSDLLHNIELGALSEKETRTYVLQRAVAAKLITDPLSDTQFKKFYQLTQGNLAKINSRLESFIASCSSHKKQRPSEFVKKHGFPLGTALFSGACCLFIANTFTQEQHSSPTVIATRESQETKATQAQLPTVSISQIPSWQESAIHQIVEHSLAKKQNLDVLNNNLGEHDVVVADTAIKITRNAKEPQSLLTVDAKTSTQKPYTIQLVASPDKVDMQRYIKNNKLLYSSAKLQHYTENKVRWYVLTIGEYSKMTEAQQSIQKLPPSLKKLNPWVRPIATLG